MSGGDGGNGERHRRKRGVQRRQCRLIQLASSLVSVVSHGFLSCIYTSHFSFIFLESANSIESINGTYDCNCTDDRYGATSRRLTACTVFRAGSRRLLSISFDSFDLRAPSPEQRGKISNLVYTHKR